MNVYIIDCTVLLVACLKHTYNHNNMPFAKSRLVHFNMASQLDVQKIILQLKKLRIRKYVSHGLEVSGEKSIFLL